MISNHVRSQARADTPSSSFNKENTGPRGFVAHGGDEEQSDEEIESSSNISLIILATVPTIRVGDTMRCSIFLF